MADKQPLHLVDFHSMDGSLNSFSEFHCDGIYKGKPLPPPLVGGVIQIDEILLMEEILHHLVCIKPCK